MRAEFARLAVNGQWPRGLPSSVRCADSFSLRAKSRLRRLRSDTRLWAQPRGGSLYFFKNSSIIFSPTAPDFSGWNWQPRTLPWLAAAQISRPP